MKLNPGDLIIDKNFNRTLTVIDVARDQVLITFGQYEQKHDLVYYKDSLCSIGEVKQNYAYEFDRWAGIEVLKVQE